MVKETDTMSHEWPIYVQDRKGNSIYLTQERWEHALDHPGMHGELLDQVLQTIRQGARKQDAYDLTKFKYTRRVVNLPMRYTHIVVVVKFSLHAGQPNNFVLTAYLVERW
jgi:hypothetical protein